MTEPAMPATDRGQNPDTATVVPLDSGHPDQQAARLMTVLGDSAFLTRVVLWNYRSIARCDVPLGPLQFLVGPNGSGKSNFLDALRFVKDALSVSLDHALRERGGIAEVRRRSSGHPTHFGIRLEFQISPVSHGMYAFLIGSRPNGGYEVQREECRITRAHDNPAYFAMHGGTIDSSLNHPLPVASDRLTLPLASYDSPFMHLFAMLTQMGFYSLSPHSMRELQATTPDALLSSDGGNITTILHRITEEAPDVRERIEEYLALVTPGIHGVDVRVLGPRETLEFRQMVKGARAPWRFLATSMSDGTLRATGILTALFQGRDTAHGRIPLVAIEEPEVALHPAAAGVLLDALREASSFTQVLVTSHSPDLLDRDSIQTDEVLAVTADGGSTTIGPVDAAGRRVLQEHLFTAGELMRQDQLRPEPAPADAAWRKRLFAEVAG